MLTNLNTRRILSAALVLAIVVPASLAHAASNGGGRGGSGDGKGDGAGARGQSPISFIAAQDPNCTPGAGCYERPKITYVKRDNACEIRVCEIEDGIRKCSSDLTDIKVCATKRS